MPPIQRGQAYRLGPNRWGLRYYDIDGVRRRKSPFSSKSKALAHYREVIEPQLRGEPVAMPDITLAELCDLYLHRHAVVARPRTIATLRQRLGYPLAVFGTTSLRELQRMSGEIAAWTATLPPRSRYGIVSALRQALGAAERWGYIERNPAKLVGPKPAAGSARDPHLHGGRAERDRRRAVAVFRPPAAVRRRDWAAARGMAGTSARGR
jgi:hypothetical protein